MLRGRFGDTTGAPYIEGRLTLPAQGRRGDVSFLVDTGADRTMLMPIDGQLMGIDYSSLSGVARLSGVDGRQSGHFEENVTLAFAEAGRLLHVYDLAIIIARPTRYNLRIPSLLGRDVIDRWRMIYDKSNPNPRLTFRVLSADLTIPI